jgi:hypothetical protein
MVGEVDYVLKEKVVFGKGPISGIAEFGYSRQSHRVKASTVLAKMRKAGNECEG